MHLFFSAILIFLVLFFLLCLYQSFIWDGRWSVGSGLRCWVGSFECGFVSNPVVEDYFSSTYFVLLVFFVVFDLEVSLLLNVPLQGILYKNLFCYLGFLVLLFIGFGFEVLKGYVDWSNWSFLGCRC